MKYILSSIILIGLLSHSFAQDQIYNPVEPSIRFLDGQVITNDGDTLSGEIQVRNKGVTVYNNRIMFKDAEGNKSYYMPEEISGFILSRDNTAKMFGSNSVGAADQEAVYFASEIQPDGKKEGREVFMQRLYYSPKISLYHVAINGRSSTVSAGGMTIDENERSYWVKKTDEPMFKLTIKNYKDNVSRLFYDCEAVKTQISENADLKDFRNLEKVLIQYRDCK